MVRTKRKRKVAVARNEEKENESESVASAPAFNNGPMYKIMSHVQTSEALHKKYIKEMQQLYTKTDHNAFMFTFIRVIKSAMECDETNEYALTSLQFCAKFIASYNNEDTHPVLGGIFEWLSKTISNNPHIRFRLCQFVNLILTALGAEAALDDHICDKILAYMLERLRDMSPSVRVQAIVAMQRLQIPDNPNDDVLRAYHLHLCSDPSPRVRQAVITCMGRNIITIPYILDRLWDIDEKVRRHTYLHMSSYSVRSYKVSQRLMLLEQGLNDRAEAVRKVVTKIMLRQWLETYQKDIVALVSALKLDANSDEIDRFRKVTKQTLLEIFKSEDRSTVMACLPLEYEGEFPRCVAHEKLTVEIALYWQCLSEFLQAQGADEFDLILPELSVFCAYVDKFCTDQIPGEDKFKNLEFQFKMHALLEILYKYDLGDEIGRGNFQKLVDHLLRNISLDDINIEIIIRCAENLFTDQEQRMKFLTEIIQEQCQLNREQNSLWNDRSLINEVLANCADPSLNLKLSGLKVKILDLEEQEMLCIEKKNFVMAQKVTDEKNSAIEEYTNLLKPLISQPLGIKKVKNENILTSLQIIYHMVVSKKVQSLSPQVCKLYNDFICRHIASVQIPIRDWALKCGTAFSMHYEPIAKEIFNELYLQFFKHHNARIWETSAKCIFEIMDMYGVDTFSPQEPSVSSKRAGRTLYNTLGSLDTDDEIQSVSADGQGVSVMYLMSHFLDTCDSVAIVSAIILGFIKLILHGFIENGDIIEKLLIRYFNPNTDTRINQYLSIFLEEMIRLKKQKLLVPSLLPTINAVLTAPYDSPLAEIRPETITRFFIEITHQDSCAGRKINLHNKIARSFLNEMLTNTNNKDVCKLLAKEILKLELDIRSDKKLKLELMEMTNKLLLCEFDVNTMKNINNFKGILEGTFNPPTAGTVNDSEEDADEDTMTNENRRTTTSATTTNARNSTGAVNRVENSIMDTLEEENEPTPQIMQISQVQGNSDSIMASADKTPNATSNATAIEKDNAAANNIENSQETTLTPMRTSQIAEISISSNLQSQSQSPSEIMRRPAQIPVTTYGRNNEIGLHCLRKSMNSSRTQSESELSEPSSVPKIRIEFRLDSETKKTNKNNDNNKEIIGSATKTPTDDASTSRRSLRQLRARKQIFPSDAVTTNSDNESSSHDSSSSNEKSESDIVPASPQPLNDVSKTRRLRTRTPQPSKSTSKSQTKSVTRSAAKHTIDQDIVPESPQPSLDASISSTRLRRAQQTQNLPSETRSTRASQRHTPPPKTTTPSTNKKRHKSPRKVLYTLMSSPLGSSRKRRYPKTPMPKNRPVRCSSGSSDSTSSSSKSPQPKQARCSNEVPPPSPKKNKSPDKNKDKRKTEDNNQERRKSADNSQALPRLSSFNSNSNVRTRSLSRKDNLMVENKTKTLPASKIPIKRGNATTSKATQSRSSSNSPLRGNAKNQNKQQTEPPCRNSHRSKIPTRKLNL